MIQSNGGARGDVASLLGSLYDAAIHPALWSAALDDIGDALGGAALVCSFQRPGGMAFGVTHRLDPEADKVLRDQYASSETNPLMAAMPRLPVLAAVAREQLIEDASYYRSGLFNDVFRSQGFIHAGLSCLARDNDVIIPCGILRRRNRDFDAECLRIYEAILPHLRRALELTVRFSDLNAARLHVEAVADAGDDAYIVTDAQARVLYCNARAERLLSVKDGLLCRCNILTTRRHEQATELQRLISGAAHRFDYVGGDMRVTRPDGRMPWALIVTPMPQNFTHAVSSGPCNGELTARALLRIIDLEAEALTPTARLMALFRLSRAEALIATSLMEGLRPEEIAARRNLRITTIRTQIRAIYLKTETSRQAELVRLLLRTAGPQTLNN